MDGGLGIAENIGAGNAANTFLFFIADKLSAN
jgi:hypothetical protein